MKMDARVREMNKTENKHDCKMPSWGFIILFEKKMDLCRIEI